MKAKQICKGLGFFLLLLLIPVISPAAFLRNIPQMVTLPDHSVIHCFASGDEFFNWLHDENGYTLIFNNDGYLYYAIRDGAGLKPSAFRANTVAPGSKGIQPGNLISPEAYQEKRNNYFLAGKSGKSPSAPHTGLISNIVVFIRFNGESEFGDPISLYDDVFNSYAVNANSMRRYYNEASYGQLDILSYFYPDRTGTMVVSYQDYLERNYFQPYNATTNPSGYQNDQERAEREQFMLNRAVNTINGQVSPVLNLDVDGDGNVDNVCFIIRGAPDGWNSLLWPHHQVLSLREVWILGKRVWDYNLQLQTEMVSNGNGDLCHEMFHTLGAPDLYHYDAPYTGLSPVARWDVMDHNLNPPEHMSAYMKCKYGQWMTSFPVLNSSGYYTLNPLNSNSSAGVAYKIPSLNSATEYFVVEYRRKTGTFEGSLPGSGMVIYRINSNFTGNAHYNGSTVFDEVYAYRPDGTPTLNGNPDNANYSQLVGRTMINSATNPTPYLSNGSPGGLNIREITDNNGTLTFLLLMEVANDIVLDMPNATGYYPAYNSVTMVDGFSTQDTPFTFQAWIVENLGKGDSPPRAPVNNLYEVQILNYSDRWISSYTISSADDIDINSIRNIPDDKGHYLSNGEYKYIISKEGAGITKGTLEIK